MARKASDAKENILESARKLFAEKGFDGVSMEDIAQASGVRKSLIYYYFPSKEVLFEEVWIKVIDELEEELFGSQDVDESGKTESGILTIIKNLIRKYVEFAMNKKELMDLIAREKLNVLNENKNLSNARNRYESLVGKVQRVFEIGKQKDVLNDVEPETAVQLVSSIDSLPKKTVLKKIEEFLLKVFLKEGLSNK